MSSWGVGEDKSMLSTYSKHSGENDRKCRLDGSIERRPYDTEDHEVPLRSIHSEDSRPTEMFQDLLLFLLFSLLLETKWI